MSTIRTNTLLHSDGSTTTQPSIPALDQRMAKAWVNFNGTGTVYIRGSYNVSSITDLGTGQYLVNLVTPMSDNTYSVVTTNRWDDKKVGMYKGYMDTGSFRLLCTNGYVQTVVDSDSMLAVAFGN